MIVRKASSEEFSAFFAYGTLMNAEILRLVTGRMLKGAPAQLSDFRRGKIRGQSYPGIIPALGSTVQGVLYQDVWADELIKLDHFEGVMYNRESVHLEFQPKTPVYVYVLKPAFSYLLTREDWDYEHFLTFDFETFTHSFAGWSAI